MKIKFNKMHGLGNDFVIIDNLKNNYQFTSEQIRFIADRKVGIGCDQVLIIDVPSDKVSDFYYRIYNADGSVASQCGNGARCFIRYLIEHRLTAKKSIQLQTRDRVIYGEQITKDLFRIMMGKPEFNPTLIPLNLNRATKYSVFINGKEISFAALSMGNPHAVIYVDDLNTLENELWMVEVASYLQNLQLFPESVNVNFIYIIDKNNILLRTYERGCGFTLACGSGACASAAVAIRDQQVINSVMVKMRGGNLQINWSNDELWMQGNATKVFCGEIEL